MTVDKIIVEKDLVKIGQIQVLNDPATLTGLCKDFTDPKDADLSLITAPYQDKWILKFQGSLDTNTVQEVENYINDLLGQGTTKVIADLELLDYISSAGLRVLLATASIIKSKQGTFRICDPNPEVKEVFDISGFSMIFSIHKNLEEALSGF